MTEERQVLLDEMAGMKTDARKRFDRAVATILSLAWAFRNEEFAWEDYPELDEKVNAVLRDLSDGFIDDAERRAKDVLRYVGLDGWDDDALGYAEREIDGESALFRLDMQSSHLKELISVWIGIAAIGGYTAYEVRREILAHGGTPQLSPLWVGGRSAVLAWGKGYQRDIVNGMTVIGQDLVNAAYQYAKVQSFKDGGAIGYRTVRGSSYYCPLCDEMTEKIWPLDVVVLPYHPRCVCIPVPVYEGEETANE